MKDLIERIDAGTIQYGLKNYSPSIEVLSPDDVRRRFPRAMMSTRYIAIVGDAVAQKKMVEVEYANTGGWETVVHMELRSELYTEKTCPKCSHPASGHDADGCGDPGCTCKWRRDD